MTLRLTVERNRWRSSVDAYVRSVDGLVPVAKGNGYGFGLAALVAEAATLADIVAVGTAFEAAVADSVRGAARLMVLTPATPASVGVLPPSAVATVGSTADVGVLVGAGWTGAVAVKLASSMRRYGAGPDDLVAVLESLQAVGFLLDSFSVHLPLVGGAYGEDDALGEIEGWLRIIDPTIALSVSHLSAAAFAGLRSRHADCDLRLRAGTALWHGDKSSLHLAADVVEVRRIAAGERAGYRLRPAPADGTLVMVGAGSAHGVTPLVDGRSPFHHARHRLSLHEPPHMHTSMLFVPDGDPCPDAGDWVDVQRPLTATSVDEIVWRP